MNRTYRALALAAIASLLVAAPVLAQQEQRPSRTPGGMLRAQAAQMRSDMLARDYFSARFVLANAEAIALTEEQRAAIETEARAAASEFGGLQFDLDNQLRRMMRLARENPVDEEAVITQLDAVLEVERGIKTLQLRTAVRVRNTLSVEQQEQLLEIRREAGMREPRQPR